MAYLLEQGKWILEEFSKGIAGAPPEAAWELLDTPPAVAENTLRWRQPFATLDQSLWVLTDGLSPAQLESAFAQLGRAMSTRLKREVVPLPGEEVVEEPPQVPWASLKLSLAGEIVTLSLGVPVQVEDLFITETKADAKTFDLLLDVELPVSVSFGRAQVALKDVLKLTTGSIVELNRAIVEPVDVVVNNCVIARGEVVVVEGNFGVRIQHVVSRGERLRSVQ